MKITPTTLGSYLEWYCFGDDNFHSIEDVVDTLEFCAFVDDWEVVLNKFVECYWDDNVNIIECEKGNGSNNGSHDVAIVGDSYILPLEAVDYAFTPLEKK